MDVTTSLDAPHVPDVVFPWVADLTLYPAWLELVVRATPEADASGAPAWPAWSVDLRGRLGPLARSKRLRMIRTALDPGHSVRFERAELDGREHSAWVLEATVDEVPDGSRLGVRLHYGGGLFGPMLEKVLAEQIERSRPRLLACIADDA